MTGDNPIQEFFLKSKILWSFFYSNLEFKLLITVIIDVTRYQGKDYRIYSRISREILDRFCTNFFQFDLYTGQRFFCLKPLFTGYMHVTRQYKCIDEI